MNNMSLEGVWSVSFGVPQNSAFGAGVLVITQGKVYGGDASYYYVGNYNVVDNRLYTQLTIKHHTGPKNNVLGPGIDEISLNLSGDLQEPDSLTLTNGTFMAKAKRLQPL